MAKGNRRITRKEWAEIQALYIESCMSVPSIIDSRRKENLTVPDKDTIYKKIKSGNWEEYRKEYLDNLLLQHVDELKKQRFEDFKIRKEKGYKLY